MEEAEEKQLDPASNSVLVSALARAARHYPIDEKLLVCRPLGIGRELLHSLVHATGGWIGFTIRTPLQLAVELVADDLADSGLDLSDELAQTALLDEAIDEVLEDAEAPGMAALGETLGFRQAIANSIEALRLAGVGSLNVAAAPLEDRQKRDVLATILAHYERRLAETRLVDTAGVLRRAVAALSSGQAEPPPGRIYLMPGLHLRGIGGEFLELLRKHGARVLESDIVVGLKAPPGILAPAAPAEGGPRGRLSYLHAIEKTPAATNEPTLDLFAAASPADELREVLRRVMAAGQGWDEVEIVSTDPLTYGSSLDSLATHLGIPITYATGLPVARTRVGRAVAAYFRWIQDDFPAVTLQRLLQTGILAPPALSTHQLDGPELARRLRSLRIGWGRTRYLQQIDRSLGYLEALPDPEQEEPSEQSVAVRDRQRAELEALRSLVEPILAATPQVPRRLSGSMAPRVTPASLARGLLSMLEFVPSLGVIEKEARRRLSDRLHRVAATLERETSLALAIAQLRNFIDIRVPSPAAEGRAPWSSAGGHLHFSDIEHGGLSGRQVTFFVGLDSSRFPGAGGQDPLLLDQDRRRLAADSLPASGERLEERRYALAALLARLRGSVTLSYSAWDSREGRNVAPASVMLQALRLMRSDPSLDYQTLHRALRPIAGPIPAGAGRVDSNDVWLGKLSDGPLLLAGTDVVREAFANLDSGLRAHASRDGETFSSHAGSIAPRPELLDPRLNSDLLLSATRLERLGQCPLRYFFKHVLEIEPADEIDLDPGVWLDPRQKGSLLHKVYERILRESRGQAIDQRSREFNRLAERILTEEAQRIRGKLPAPNDAVFDNELEALKADIEVFVKMTRKDGGHWLDLELQFGYGVQGQPPVELQVPGGMVRLRGAVDRSDETENRNLLVIDYKTGSNRSQQRRTRAFDGGRRLQHALYTQATEVLLGRRVERIEYRFPTRRGEMESIAYSRSEIEKWPLIVGLLLDLVAEGNFVPTDEPDDCRFCDYKDICHVQERGYGSVASPPASWAKTHAAGLSEYAPLLRVRKIDEARQSDE
ncbi:MAG: PD-(D/E)XK nuclease family protein [Acidobacteriota bacterium]